MSSTYHFKSAEEISEDFIKVIKMAYKTKSVSITIEEEVDTTEYLNASESNRKFLERSISQSKESDIIFSIGDL